jgi:L-lactate utilization protein LutB
MLDAREWHEKLKIENTMDALERNGFHVKYYPTSKDALEGILEMIPKGVTIGIGGSVTLREIGLVDALETRDLNIANHWKANREGASQEEIMKIRRTHINSDVFLTSTNAITESGELVNIDGTGQRVAAMIFGPKKVIVVTGVNKITGDLEEGLWRASNIAAPMNARRLHPKTPCAETGECDDCLAPGRICNITTILHRKPSKTDVTVVLVGEKLGY